MYLYICLTRSTQMMCNKTIPYFTSNFMFPTFDEIYQKNTFKNLTWSANTCLK